jgi:hypothetical protein
LRPWIIWLRRCEEKDVLFLKKRTKKLLFVGVPDPASVRANEQKSFASLLQKRRPSLLLSMRPIKTWYDHSGC